MIALTSTEKKNIGDRPLSLATHLRATVDLLLDTTTSNTYNWSNCTLCNCGMLARTILRLSRVELGDQLNATRKWGTWTTMAAFVESEDTPEGIFKDLITAGMDLRDFEHLEFLSHPDLAKPEWITRAKLNFTVDYLVDPDFNPEMEVLTLADNQHYRVVENAAYYLLAWAKVIEFFHKNKEIFGSQEMNTDVAVTSINVSEEIVTIK